MNSPPSLPALLLARRLSPEWREYVLGDLEEEFVARAAQSPAAARRCTGRRPFVAWSRHLNRHPLLTLP